MNNYIEDLIAKIKKNFLVPLNDFSESEKRLFNPIRQELKKALQDCQKRERERIVEMIEPLLNELIAYAVNGECGDRSAKDVKQYIINKIKELK